MTTPFHIKTGQVLICNFDGYIAPEIEKTRPVVVISRSSTHNRKLCTIVPLSTTAPFPVEAWHIPVSNLQLPQWQSNAQVWAKCDLIYTVSFARLTSPYARENRQRAHQSVKIRPIDLDAIYVGVRAYLPQGPVAANPAPSPVALPPVQSVTAPPGIGLPTDPPTLNS